VYPPCLRHPFGGIFFCGSFFPLGRFFEYRIGPKGDLGAGGSVATSAWDFARILGAKRVWIAGLDLSFPENKTHFRGAVFEEKSHAESYRFFPAETWNFRALRDGFPFPARKRGGGTVLTDKRLSLYAAWFEKRFSQFPDVKNSSLSAQGLDIKSLEVVPEGRLLALPERRGEIDDLLNGAFTSIERNFNSGEARQNRAEKYGNALNTLFEGLREIKNLAEGAAESAGTAASGKKQGRLDDRGQERAFKKLDAVNISIQNSAVKEIAGFLFPDTERWEEEITAADPFMRHLEFSARFYRALAEAVRDNLEILTGIC
jgi:hypothetical protein